MHKFLRAIGFSTYQKKKDITNLVNTFIDRKDYIEKVEVEEDINFCEIRGEVSPGMGISICGEMDEEGNFQTEYYYPYLINKEKSSDSECTIQRHTEKETYSGLLDEYKVGISLIFYVENISEYKKLKSKNKSITVDHVCLTGLSIKGKILLPIKKTKKQIESARVASKNRCSLLEAAKNGDEDAMETLTIQDIDLYSQISRRIIKEDIYSIIDSCFMPCGVECDQYAIIGEIIEVETLKNNITEEEVYNLKLESSDLIFHVVINKKDLLGEPIVGRRFKGQIWMQGTVMFKA